MKTKQVRLAVHFPGQAVKKGLNVDSLKTHSGLLPVVNEVNEAFVDTVSGAFGTAVPGKVLNASEESLKADTFLAQLRSFYESMTFWMALMKASFNGEPPLEERISENSVLMQLAGHSLGGATSKYAPGPGSLEEQLSNIAHGTLSVGYRAIPMCDTPHAYDVGGMAAILGLRGWQVNKLLKRVNRSSEHGIPVIVANNNAPKIKIIAGPREELKRIGSSVKGSGCRFVDEISNYWFHHPAMMQQASLKYWAYLGSDGALGNPCPLFSYVSYVTGNEVPPSKFRQDLAEGVWKPVQYYTLRGPSVHGAAHKKGFYNVIVFNHETAGWLRESGMLRTHLVNDLNTLAEFNAELARIIEGEAAVGKLKVSKPQQHPVPVYQT